MVRCSSLPIRLGVCLGLAVAAGAIAPRAQNAFSGISLSVSKETAPPGGMGQVKVFVTEPKPVSTGGGTYMFDAYDSVEGIALINAVEDVAGIALVRGTLVDLSFTSPSATFGMDLDYPILVVAGRIPADAPVGMKYPMRFDASSLQLFDAAGAQYPIEVKPGHLITWPGVSIHDVNPGSAFVPAGGTVTITGSDFEPRTEIKFSETKLSRVTYVNRNRIDVVVASDVHMHGMMIKATNRDGSRSTYFSYQRTRPHGVSTDSVLRYAVPLVPPAAAADWQVAFGAPTLSHTYGIAVQNVETAGASVSLQLLDAAGAVVAESAFDLPSNFFVVRELSELFPSASAALAGPCAVRVTSVTPVQVLGVSADQNTGKASPVLARK